METRSKIVEIIRKVSHKDVTPAPDDSLFDSGLLDSFVLTDMVTEIEKAFSIKVPDSDLNPRKWDTIERIESYLEGRL
ncbi:MAG: phosphopantetheine-binding protein [Bryobacteraceae bacterium]